MLRFTAFLGLCCAASIAQAADNGFYLGAGATQTDYGFSNPGGAQPFDNQTSGYKLIAGWRPLDKFGVEATYVDHGDARLPSGVVCTQFITTPCPSSTRLTAKTLSAFAIGYLDLPLVDLFMKAGVNSWKFDGQSTGGFVPVFRVNESGTDFAFGAGVQVRFGSLGARLEYERLDFIQSEHLDTVSLSLTYTFL